jgi:transketolase
MNENTDIRDAFFDSMLEEARKNKNIILLSADMDAFSLRVMEKDLPSQYHNVGVSEQNMINIASGLALTGKIVFCYSIASFATMRCYEQIKVNLCSMNLPVIIVGAGAGFSFGYDGPTHHGHQDLSSMRLLPEMGIIDLSSNDIAKQSVKYCINQKNPFYIRLDKGPFPNYNSSLSDFKKGYRVLKPLSEINIVTSGFLTERVCKVAEKLKKKFNLTVGVVDLFCVKPINIDFFNNVIKISKKIYTIEESCTIGGLGTILSEMITDNENDCKLFKIGAPNKQFIEYGSREWFHKKYKLDLEGIISQIQSL